MPDERHLDAGSENGDGNAEWQKVLLAMWHRMAAAQTAAAGLTRYATDFIVPYMISSGYFSAVEAREALDRSPLENLQAYQKLLGFNLDLINKGVAGGMSALNAYLQLHQDSWLDAWRNTFTGTAEGGIDTFYKHQADLIGQVVYGYPEAIRAIEPEFGFQFRRNNVKPTAETDRFLLYQVAPNDKNVATDNSAKPVLILPPYVLGANILGFLPGEQKSYAHCFANQGIPTYIRILKDIRECDPLQVMTGEDDAVDTRTFCRIIKKRHEKAVTLNGYCQGGFSALCNILSGELDGLVDAFITCVAPMDGTRSRGLAQFLKRLPQRFNRLEYGTKTLSNGNQVADGLLMGWVYKLKSIDHESPYASFMRDLSLLSRQKGNTPLHFSKTAAALNYWLMFERFDLPLAITRMSFASYNTPITEDGTLPVKLFDRKLNISRLKDKQIPWLICYGEHDDLVEKETALAPLDFIDAEVSPYPKGHVAIATSWSHPQSDYALHTTFGDKPFRGPVRFQLDLDQKQKKGRAPKKAAKARKAPVKRASRKTPSKSR
jgi:hypothetical protein